MLNVVCLLSRKLFVSLCQFEDVTTVYDRKKLAHKFLSPGRKSLMCSHCRYLRIEEMLEATRYEEDLGASATA